MGETEKQWTKEHIYDYLVHEPILSKFVSLGTMALWFQIQKQKDSNKKKLTFEENNQLHRAIIQNMNY